MKKFTIFRRALFVALTVAVGGLLLSSCSKEEGDYAPIKDKVDTRGAENGWICPKCKFHNSFWQSYCAQCRTEYTPSHNELLYNFMLTIEDEVKLVKNPPPSGPIGNRNKPIELHTQVYPAYTPPEWYETTSCMKIYNELKNSWNSRFVPGYIDGVECGWYRTTRVLYPGKTDINEIERLYTRFELEHWREFPLGEGQGILDATDAAIKAFKNCR